MDVTTWIWSARTAVPIAFGCGDTPRLEMMKRIFLLLLLLLLILPTATAFGLAQAPTVTELESLAVELWPDYDRPSVLVLLTIALPADAPLPATVSIPLPEDADLNAVAGFSEPNALVNIDQFEQQGDRLMVTTPDRRFRVEYYVPYTANGTERSFTFDWTSDLAVNQLSTVVQQPLAAANLAITPEPVAEGPARGDGLNYFELLDTSLAPGETFTVDIGYEMPVPTLSAELVQSDGTGAATGDSPAAVPTATTQPNNWTLIAIGGGLLLIALALFVWQIISRRNSGQRARKPRPQRAAAGTKARPAQPAARPKPQAQTAAGGKARFCHNCGTAAAPEDRFCSNCGTQLKQL